MKDSQEALDRYTFLNPAFGKNPGDEEYLREHGASDKAYMASALVQTAIEAFSNEGSATPLEQRGIEKTLSIAEAILGDVIDACERLERAFDEQTAALQTAKDASELTGAQQ